MYAIRSYYAVFGISGILFPLIIGALGLIATIIGILTVTEKDAQHEDPMHRITSYNVCYTKLLR